jgi:hypothetical protein
MSRFGHLLVVALATALVGAACGSSGRGAASPTPAANAPKVGMRSPGASVAIGSTTMTVSTTSPCGSGAPPPATYQHVVVVMEENRTWARVGGPGFAAMPYAHSIATRCAFYTQWHETNPNQNSLTQYIGLTSGVDNPATVNDCAPSATCRSTDDNIYRQVRVAGGTPRTYVEGATTGCSAAGNAAKHIPALYYYGANDHSFCRREVRPLGELDVNHLPTFAMIIPDLCNDGHDCANGRVDAWLHVHLAALLAGSNYRTGTTAVFVLYDEDRPAPNLLIAPTADKGPLASPIARHSAALRTIEAMLGLPALASVSGAPNLRPSAHI